MVLITRTLLYVIGDNVEHAEPAHSGVEHVAAGRAANIRTTISVSSLKEFTETLRYNTCLRLCDCAFYVGVFVCAYVCAYVFVCGYVCVRMCVCACVCVCV